MRQVLLGPAKLFFTATSLALILIRKDIKISQPRFLQLNHNMLILASMAQFTPWVIFTTLVQNIWTWHLSLSCGVFLITLRHLQTNVPSLHGAKGQEGWGCKSENTRGVIKGNPPQGGSRGGWLGGSHPPLRRCLPSKSNTWKKWIHVWVPKNIV